VAKTGRLMQSFASACISFSLIDRSAVVKISLIVQNYRFAARKSSQNTHLVSPGVADLYDVQACKAVD
jgi:hypothetical protein